MLLVLGMVEGAAVWFVSEAEQERWIKVMAIRFQCLCRHWMQCFAKADKAPKWFLTALANDKDPGDDEEDCEEAA